MDDLYGILELEFKSTDKQVRKAYLRMAKIWHPDKNPGIDVTHKMQKIIYAYEILSNEQKKKQYDIEYIRFFDFINNQQKKTSSNTKSTNNSKSNYEFSDKLLKKWMKEAKDKAVHNYKIFIEELSKSISVGFNNYITSVFFVFIYVLLISLIVKILFVIFEL